MQTIHVCRTSEDLARTAQRLMAIALPRAGVDVVVRRHRMPRSCVQNARLWWLHNLYSAWLNAERMRLVAAGALPAYWPEVDAEAVHRQIFRPRYCAGRSSTRLSKLDFAEALTRYEADLVNLGVEIPDPPESVL